MPLLTGGCLQEFRGLELVGWTARRCGGQVFHRLVRHLLIEALDDHGVVGGLFQLREDDDHTKPNEQHEHEYDARSGASAQLLNLGQRNAPARFRFSTRTLYMTSPRRTSSMASPSAFFGSGPSAERI